MTEPSNLTAIDPPRPAIAGPPVRLLPVAVAFTIMAALALVIANVGARFGSAPAAPEPLGWFAAWVRYDSGWYYAIARDGYFFQPGVQSSVAFFPTYPLLMRAGGEITGVYVTGVALTLAAGLAAVLLFTRWCASRLSRGAALTAVALLLVYPYSFYLYGAVYADALFLACALGAFVLLERGNPLLAGLVGALATAGRPLGVAVAVGLAVRAVELAAQRSAARSAAATDPEEAAPRPAASGRARVVALWQQARDLPVAALKALRHVRLRDTGVLLAFSGLAGYMAYQWVTFGTPVAFVITESAPGWDQGTGPYVLFKAGFVYTLLYGSAAEVVRLVVPALLCLAVVLLLPRVHRRFGWGYTIFVAIAVAIPILGTKDFMGSGRYLLVVFPVFAVVGELLAEEWSRKVRPVLMSAFAVLLVIATAAYGQGFEVS